MHAVLVMNQIEEFYNGNCFGVNEYGGAGAGRGVPVSDVPSEEYAVWITVYVPWRAMHIDREEVLFLVQLPGCETCV